jgi:hypothetical protein
MKSILPLLLLAGCAGPLIHMQIDSEPRGAHVFFATGANESFAASSKSYIGTTPFVWDYQAKGDGSFDLPGAPVYSSFVPGVAVFTATPPANATNLYTVRYVYHGGTIGTPPDKVPTGIFFDLTKPSNTP